MRFRSDILAAATAITSGLGPVSFDPFELAYLFYDFEENSITCMEPTSSFHCLLFELPFVAGVPGCLVSFIPLLRNGGNLRCSAYNHTGWHESWAKENSCFLLPVPLPRLFNLQPGEICQELFSNRREMQEMFQLVLAETVLFLIACLVNGLDKLSTRYIFIPFFFHVASQLGQSRQLSYVCSERFHNY